MTTIFVAVLLPSELRNGPQSPVGQFVALCNSIQKYSAATRPGGWAERKLPC